MDGIELITAILLHSTYNMYDSGIENVKIINVIKPVAYANRTGGIERTLENFHSLVS